MITELLRILTFVAEAFLHIWPLLLITIPLSIIIKEIGISSKINTLLKKNIGVSILIATLVGAIAPFCSCSVIPVIASMLLSGVPIAPIMAFWLASPSMDPEIFFLSVASLGWPLAIARITATFIMSLVGAYVTHLLIGKRFSNSTDLLKIQPSCTSGCQSEKGASENAPKRFQPKKIVLESRDAIWMILKFLVIAYILEAIILFYVPDSMVLAVFGDNKFTSILRATLFSVPLYTTNLSALGVMGGLLEKGLTEGAALAFLIGGATTTIPAMAAVYRLVHNKVFTVYLSITIIFAIMSGLVYELILGLI